MRRTLVYAWWYLSISLGFLALAARTAVVGGSDTGVAVRLVVALGFAALSYLTFRQHTRER
jgi:hypothetical protein